MEKVYSAKWLSGRALELSSGTVIRNPHNDQQCADTNCAIHNPSDHPYRDLPLDFNGVNMVRVDPSVEGGIRLDPDDYSYARTGQAILRNSALCLQCWSEITSKFRHNFVNCECKNVAVDGGYDYIRHLWTDAKTYEDTSIVITIPKGPVVY